MRKLTNLAWYGLVLSGCLSAVARGRVEVYPGPDGIAPSEAHRVTVIQDGRRYPSFVYQSRSTYHNEHRGATTSWTTFSFAGPVTVEVARLAGPARSCITRPLRFGVEPTLRGDTAVFTLDRPRKLSIEFDGDITHSMLLFADALETDVPRPTDPDVMYFGPGQHNVGIAKPVPANTTVYLAGGAYVFGSFHVDGDDVVIRGRGVLSGGKWRKYNETKNPDSGILHDFKMIEGRWRNCEVEGITIVDFPSYAVLRCTRIENLKTIGWYYNCDGLDVIENSMVKDCFLKVNDDALKLYWDGGRVEDVTIWQYRNGAPFQWGWHGLSSSGVVVRNCDVIHVEYEGDTNNRAVFNAARKKGGRRSNYLFENITIEEPHVWRLFKFNLSDDAEITGQVFRNLRLAGPPARQNEINGDGRVELIFENAAVVGEPVQDAAALGFRPEDADAAVFREPSGAK